MSEQATRAIVTGQVGMDKKPYVEAVKERANLPPAMARRAQLVYLARNVTNAQEIMNSVAVVYAEARGNPMFPTIARASAFGSSCTRTAYFCSPNTCT